MQNEYNEEVKNNNEASEENGEYAYKNVMKTKQNRRTWSLISLSLAVLSILFLWVCPVSLGMAVASVVCALISRKNLGYFDKLSLAGLFVGIFGIVFSIVGMAFGEIIGAFLA